MSVHVLPPAGRTPLLEPPHNTEAEQAILGILLMYNARLEQVEFLQPKHFYETVHQRLFKAMRETIESGGQANPVSLGPRFKNDPALVDVGGQTYLVQLVKSAMSPMNVPFYGRQLVELWQRRETIKIANQLEADAADLQPSRPLRDAMADAQRALEDVDECAEDGDEMRPIGYFVDRALEAAEKAQKNPGALRGLSTGIHTLDKKTGGLRDADFIILAGRSSMGKTALAGNIAINVARQGKPVAFYSLEMTGDELGARTIATEADVDGSVMHAGTVTGLQFSQLFDAANELRGLPLYINENGVMSMAKIRRSARRIKREHGLALVVVDYLQLIDVPGAGFDNRVQALSATTRALKLLAKELGVPVIALSQLSREVEKREDKRPQLSDLRESGSIEQDADVVMFVFRESYYLGNAPPRKRSNERDETFNERRNEWLTQLSAVRNLAEVILAKQRKGATGTCVLRFDPAVTKFSDLQAGERTTGDLFE